MDRIASTVPRTPSRARRRTRSLFVAAEGLERRTLFALPEVNLLATEPVATESTRDDGVLTVTRTGNPALPLTVYLDVRPPLTGPAATSGVDFDPLPASITIPAGASWTNIPVHVRPDSIPEPFEGILVLLAPNRSYAVGARSGAGVYIQDAYYADRTEPNDTLSDAWGLGMVSAAGVREWLPAISRPGDLDHYRFTANAGEVPMAVMIEFDHTQGDLNLAVFTDRGREIARSTGAGDVERLVLPPAPGESYLVRVWGEKGATSPKYAIDVRPVRSGPALYFATKSFNSEIRFPVLQPGQAARETATLVNVGDQPLELGRVELPPGFTLVDAPEATLEAGKSESVTVEFAGTAAPGVHTADATFNTNGPDGGRQGVRLVTPVAGVVARRFLYKNSAADANSAPYAFSRNAIDPDKWGLTPGEVETIGNVSSYDRGINGVVLTIVRDNRRALAPEDFAVRASDPDGAPWRPGPGGLNVVTSVAPGVDGDNYSTSDVALIWPNYDPGDPFPQNLALVNGWLEVTAKANEHTSLGAQDVSYYGNLIGDVVDGSDGFKVNALDLAAVRAHRIPIGPGSVARYDINRDGVINALDLAEVRANYGRTLPPIVRPAPTPSLFSTARIATGRDEAIQSLLQ